MMQHSSNQSVSPSLMFTVGQARNGMVLLAHAIGGAPQAALLSARIAPEEVRRFVAARCQALVLTAACGTPIVIDFIANAAACVAPKVLHCDALHIGNQAQLWVQGRTLHIRAFNIDTLAQGEQRLRGATVHLG